MEIEDRRTAATSWIPAVEVLQDVLPFIPAERLLGVRTIALLDRHPRGHLALYVPVKGTRMADIEMFFDGYTSTPDELRADRLFWTFTLTSTLGHELYHHTARGGKRRRPGFDAEQSSADQWGQQLARTVMTQLYPAEQLRAWVGRMKELDGAS